MKIRWFGHSFFEITTKNREGKEITVHTDPYDSSIGYKPPEKLTSDVVTVSHPHFDHNNTKIFSNIGVLLDTAGEYSVNGAEMKGVLTFHDKKEGAEKGTNIVFTIDSEDMRLAHLGDLGHILTDEQIREIGKVDILLTPVGGSFSLNGDEAAKVVKQLEPKIVIPMHYKTPELKLDLEGTDKFCDNLGICPQEPVNQFSIKASSLGKEDKELEIIILNRSKK